MTDSIQTRETEELFRSLLLESIAERSFKRLLVSRPLTAQGLTQVEGFPREIRGEAVISTTYRFDTREELHHHPLSNAAVIVSELIERGFLALTIFTETEEISLQYSRKKKARLERRKLSTAISAPTLQREKKYLIDPSAPFLFPLGITTRNGEVRREMYDKFRQINKFIEIIDSLIRDSELVALRSLSLIDFGSGKHYLTFALYHYLTESSKKEAKITGIEARPELVELGNRIAVELGYSGLEFRAGAILDAKDLESDIVVALHACDTATDDALAQAITGGAKIIAVAPCCHKYVRRRMNPHQSITSITRHGILAERFADALTDSLRALLLESLGYEAKVFEFVSKEHTAKNLMLTAVRKKTAQRTGKSEELAALKIAHGLSDFYLDLLIPIDK